MGTRMESGEFDVRELSFEETEHISAGLVPLALAAAVATTGVTFKFTLGIFDGLNEKYGK